MKRLASWSALLWIASAALRPATAAEQPSTREEWQEPLTGLIFVLLPGNCYQMGNTQALHPEDDRQLLDAGYRGPRYADEAPVHQVCIDPFWIARTETTAEQWQQVMGSTPAVGSKKSPVAGISWQQAQHFAQQLTLNNPGDFSFRLPTEAEWEYACRGGRDEELQAIFEDEHLGIAWYSSRHRRHSSAADVGQLTPNDWGLKDMLGNVWEWTADNYSASGYLQHAYKNPKILNDSDKRVIRGGSFRSSFKNLRCSRRSSYPEKMALEQIGFRLIRSATP